MSVNDDCEARKYIQYKSIYFLFSGKLSRTNKPHRQAKKIKNIFKKLKTFKNKMKPILLQICECTREL